MVLPQLSVVICSLNGAAGVDRCLRSLETQTAWSSLEVIVVDDGSTDTTTAVARAHDATVVRHAANLGLAAARNSGISAAAAPIVAFLDDDCEPEPQWAAELLAGYAAGVTGVGGPVVARLSDCFLGGYLQRNNPIKPAELHLAEDSGILARLWLYLGRQWTRHDEFGRRDIYSFAGANMSFRRQALAEVGGFDERFRFGAEELDLCMRLMRAFPSGRHLFIPEARVDHHFAPSMRDTLRRSRAYGRGTARLYRKWPSVGPTLFPGPFLVLAILLASVRYPVLLAAALVTPHLLYPRGLRDALARRSPASVLDAYVQLGQETCDNAGFLEGLWRFRHLKREPSAELPLASQGDEARLVP